MILNPWIFRDTEETPPARFIGDGIGGRSTDKILPRKLSEAVRFTEMRFVPVRPGVVPWIGREVGQALWKNFVVTLSNDFLYIELISRRPKLGQSLLQRSWAMSFVAEC